MLHCSLSFPNVICNPPFFLKKKVLTWTSTDHGQFFHQIPDDVLADMLPLAKKVAIAIGLEDGQYNLLQVKLK